MVKLVLLKADTKLEPDNKHHKMTAELVTLEVEAKDVTKLNNTVDTKIDNHQIDDKYLDFRQIILCKIFLGERK